MSVGLWWLLVYYLRQSLLLPSRISSLIKLLISNGADDLPKEMKKTNVTRAGLDSLTTIELRFHRRWPPPVASSRRVVLSLVLGWQGQRLLNITEMRMSAWMHSFPICLVLRTTHIDRHDISDRTTT